MGTIDIVIDACWLAVDVIMMGDEVDCHTVVAGGLVDVPDAYATQHRSTLAAVIRGCIAIGGNLLELYQ